MTDPRWTLWVFAGPSISAGASATSGQPLALAGLLPTGADVTIVAETVGAPTLLQELTDEWPAQRLAAGPGQRLAIVQGSRAERDLGRFVAWAEKHTPDDSRRALIVLGDVLQAVGAAPLAQVPGGYRPSYPSQIKLKKIRATGTIIEDYVQQGAGLDQYLLTGATSSVTVQTILGDLLANDILWFLDAAGGPATGFNADGYKKTATNYLVIGQRAWTTIVDDTTAGCIILTAADPPPTRGLDDLGLAAVDLAARRVDVLAQALGKRHLDLLVSDDGELAQLGGMRRLAAQATVLLTSQHSRLTPGQPLVALLAALAADPGLAPEALAAAAIAGVGPATPSVAAAPADQLVALRGASAVRLIAGLDELAREVLDADEDTSARRCLAEVCREGGDLGRLTARLARIDADRARTLSVDAAATLVARTAVTDTTTLGIRLDGPGLQLGISSPWTRLLDVLGGAEKPELARLALSDLQAMHDRRTASAAPIAAATPLRMLEYRPVVGADFSATHHFDGFLSDALTSGAPARHLVLIVRGPRAPARPASVAVGPGESLSTVALARSVKEALARHGRGPLAALVLDDPELLGLEIAYELRDVAHVLLTGAAGSPAPTLRQLEDRLREAIVRRCERDAARLPAVVDAPSAARVHPWRRDVARRLAAQLVAPDSDGDGELDEQDRDDDDDGVPDTRDKDDDGDGVPDAQEERGVVALQGIDMRHIEALCRRLDRLCRLMFDGLGEPSVLAAVHAGATAPSLLEFINRAQMQGLHSSDTTIARDLNAALGDVYNWISGTSDSIREAGAPFWIDPRFAQDRSPGGHAARLRLTLAANQPRDYRELSFHQNVRLHALLAAGRLLDGPAAQRLWSLISLGLDYAPDSERGRQLARLLGEPSAVHYFANLGAPPLLRLDLERDPTGSGYELRLSSSESTAVLVRQRSVVDLAAIDRSLAGLGYVLSRGAAASDGWRYLEAIGAGLAEDIVHNLRTAIERERAALLASGRSREAHLALALPRELMRYPWELMRLPSEVPGQPGELLAERFALGRQMWVERELRRVRRDGNVRVLLIGDPPSSAPGLPGARAEVLAIQALCQSLGQELGAGFTFECHASVGEVMTRTVLRKLIRDGAYDVVHFAGHGTYDSQQPERSGWQLSDGLLTVTELRNTLAWSESPPWLIYANACSAGMTSDRAPGHYDGEVHGMADACVRVGVSAYLAPLWKIHDESARLLATEFYRRLLLERATIGVALHGARALVRKTWETARGDAGLGDISWVGMVLFGNPGARLNDEA